MERPSGFRWVILFLLWFCMVAMGMAWFCTPPIMPLMAEELHLGIEQEAFIHSLPTIFRLFLSLAAGIMGTAIGNKKVIGMSVTVVGISAIVRYFAESYSILLVGTVLLGAGFTLAFPNCTPLIAKWFPRKQLGTAAGIFMTSIAIGTAVAMILTPSIVQMTGTWRGPYLIFGIIVFVVALAWWILGKDRPPTMKTNPQQAPPKVSLKEGLFRVAKSKNVWLLTGTFAFVMMGFFGVMSLLPKILISTKGIEAATAAYMTSALSLAMIIGNLGGPAASEKMGLRKPLLYIGFAIPAVLLYILGMVSGTSLWVLLIVIGAFMGIPFALILTIPIELKEVGPAFAGAANGLMIMFGMGVGGFIGPMLSGYIPITNLLTVYSVLVAAGLVFLVPLTETGPRKR